MQSYHPPKTRPSCCFRIKNYQRKEIMKYQPRTKRHVLTANGCWFMTREEEQRKRTAKRKGFMVHCYKQKEPIIPDW